MKTLLRGAMAFVIASLLCLAPASSPIAAADKFAGYQDSVSAPSRSTPPITPSDATPLTTVPKALYIGTGGNVTLRSVDDSFDSVFKNVPSGAILAVRAQYVRATGTTAADIVALD